MKSIKLFAAVILTTLFLSSCKKDAYIVGGNTHPSTKVDMTTYDYLKSNAHGLFDTLLLIVDAAGLKDLFNKTNVTLFAPTDYSINGYLNYRTKQEQAIDPFRQWSIDSLLKYDLGKFADSMKIYFIDQPLTFDKLTNNGAVYKTLFRDNEAVVSYEYATPDDSWYNPLLSVQPQTVHFTYLYEHLDPPIVATEITADLGARTLVQTSGIQTNTGMLNVLNNNHILFFRKL